MKGKQHFSDLEGKKIALLGLGLDHRALIALLAKHKVKAELTICDKKNPTQLAVIKTGQLSIKWQTGKQYNQNLEKFDIIFRSPGWPVKEASLNKARRSGKKITSVIQLFINICPTKNLIGVTGTKGKGTTATLIEKILCQAGKTSWLGGNIGISPLSFLDKIKPSDYVILELSSFQLEDLESSPEISVITNFFPEHLAPADPNNPNFHPSLSAYWKAKINIASHPDNRWLIINNTLRRRLATTKIIGSPIFFSASTLPSCLAGTYNQENIGAAVAVAKILKIPVKSYQQTIASFSNLENRLELVTKQKGVSYYNNSFATTPESSALDLYSFTEPIVLIAGGADKGANFSVLAKAIKKRVKRLILLPGAGTKRLQQALNKSGYSKKLITEATDMAEAVKLAKKQAVAGEIILLSTGCASFGLFSNYKERGASFKHYAKS